MLPSLSRICVRNAAPCSTAAYATFSRQFDRRQHRFNRKEYHNNRNKNNRSGWSKRNFGRETVGPATTLLALSWITTFKDALGIEKIQLDKDPLKEKIKQSWLYRKRRQYTEAIQVLEIALEEAEERKEELPITRVYDELANTFYEKLDLENADKFFRIVIHRLVELHGKKDFDPEFIGVSLKLADILASKGQLDNAESGFKHCVRRQMKVMDEHMKKFSVAHGALMEDRHTVDTHGHIFTDPIALFGMALEAYANFLINYRDESRLAEAEEYIDEVMKISYQIYGPSSPHSINLLNNFGATLILKNRFNSAKKYLAIGVERILYVNECSHMLPGYYCNYAEALFHTGDKAEALEYAKKAVQMSRSSDEHVRKYTEKFLKDLERDMNKGKKKTWWFF